MKSKIVKRGMLLTKSAITKDDEIMMLRMANSFIRAKALQDVVTRIAMGIHIAINLVLQTNRNRKAVALIEDLTRTVTRLVNRRALLQPDSIVEVLVRLTVDRILMVTTLLRVARTLAQVSDLLSALVGVDIIMPKGY